MRRQIWVGLIAAISWMATVSGAEAGTVTVRSGNGVAPPGSDANVTMLVGPANAAFAGAFTAGDFASASSGPAAFVVAPHPSWKPHLTSDPAAEWISPLATGPAEGSTALYAIDLDLGAGPFSSVLLDFSFLIDNELGDANNEGLFLNGLPVPGTKKLGVVVTHFNTDQSFPTIDVTSLVHSGVNTLYVNAVDRGGPSGLQFSATFTTTPSTAAATVPLPAAAWSGLGMLALGGLVRLRRRRQAALPR